MYLVSLDDNDPTATYQLQSKILSMAEDIIIHMGISKNKIAACNRDVYNYKNWDILILASDDMEVQVVGWDKIIIDAMGKDTDQVLYYPDGYTNLNTMCILGKKYYDRFGYIYHPDYISLWCDNHFQEVAQRLGKEKRFTKVLFKHQHPMNIGSGNDDLYKRNEKYYHEDKKTFERYKRNNFGL